MLKPQELSPGNVVVYGGSVHVIIRIESDNNHHNIAHTVDGIGGKWVCFASDLSPIPLTTDVLRYLGFEYSKDFECWTCGENEDWGIQNRDEGYYLANMNKLIGVEFAHTLQNLWLALTGEILEYKQERNK